MYSQQNIGDILQLNSCKGLDIERENRSNRDDSPTSQGPTKFDNEYLCLPIPKKSLSLRPPVMSDEVASSLAKDILNGLHLIHEKNVIHRDLKPENILLHKYNDENDEQKIIAKIADFGLSAQVNANVL